MAIHLFQILVLLSIIVSFLNTSNALPATRERYNLRDTSLKFSPNPGSSSPWFIGAQDQLKYKLSSFLNEKKAQNIILFLGDGMSITTITAARILRGQRAGMLGEDAAFVFDEFPHTGLSKTYCIDKQVPDSACTATAYLGGVKNNIKTIGVTGAVGLQDCEASRNLSNHVESIAAWAQAAGMETGIVTTTRITHATPAGTYGHTSHRDWESDKDVYLDGFDPTECEDLASQLIRGDVGMNFKVILGGGRKKFLPNTTLDPDGLPGERMDGEDLTEIWKRNKAAKGEKAAYVTNKKEMLGASGITDYMLGLFHHSHMEYHLKADPEKHPRLAEMTSVALDLVSKKNKRYFLFIEGGRIDHGHHKNFARKALDETIEFAEAIELALDKTDKNTLIVVTSDHGHTMSLSGYPNRGDDILSTKNKAKDNLVYTTLSYATGPGFKELVNGSKFDTSTDDIYDVDYRHSSTIPLTDETHGGEDVLVFAHGPWSHLFGGVFEQNYIPHAMAYAACIGPGMTACIQRQREDI